MNASVGCAPERLCCAVRAWLTDALDRDFLEDGLKVGSSSAWPQHHTYAVCLPPAIASKHRPGVENDTVSRRGVSTRLLDIKLVVSKVHYRADSRCLGDDKMNFLFSGDKQALRLDVLASRPRRRRRSVLTNEIVTLTSIVEHTPW